MRAPTPRPEQLLRPRLLELLGEALHHKVTLISAPAGYGKTTLLTQWIQAEDAGLSFAWVSLDEQDNDPVRMWRHIVEALRRVAPEEGFGADVLVEMSAGGQKLVEIVLPMLINELTEFPHRVILVLDDYHFVTAEDSHKSVAFFIEYLPENVHLVFASRSDPPLPLGRLRVRGELNEIRTQQLAFSEQEAACLLNEKMSLGLGSDDISVLLAHTEGWPAGIYLAALSLQNREDKHAFIESFGGSNRYIVDLLGGEVLAGLSEEVREFLIETSVLRRLTGPLCDEVAGREGSGKVLRELARSNLFVVSLDEQGEWYRYHFLFTDLLLYELRSSRPELVPILHGRASVWFEDGGFFEGAIRYAIAAADYERAGMLVARHWFGYVLVGQTATVERWLAALPGELITRDAALLLVRAWIYALSGRSEEAERFLAIAESLPYEGPLPDGTASVEAGVATLRAVFAYGVQSALEATRRSVALEPERTSPWTALIRFGLGSSSYLSGETSLARKQFEEALELIGAGQPLLQMVTLAYLSIVVADEGHLEEAESLAREAGALVERFGLQKVPQSSWAPIALGYVLAKRGNLAEAQTELESGISTRMTLPSMSPWPTLIGLLALARVRSARGNRDGTREVLTEARSILERRHPDVGNFAEHLERLERKLRPRKSPKGQLDDELTERELEVLRLFDGELTTQQIAQRLCVAPSTVRTYIKSIHRKLGVSSRKEAVKQAHTKGLL